MTRLFRRAVAAPLVGFLAAAGALAATAAPAVADDSSTLTVVGTSDVFDSNLVQAVIKPGFEAAFPGVTLNYVSKGTGAAISYAEAGSASALIVHAAALENQFVDQGYSLEQYGRAIFWGDYVLLGPASDPAKVTTGAKHDIVTAFEKIAAAGAKGKANFVSRGGTPGTTVQEHALWALSNGVPTCDVTDVNGGGEAPSTTPGVCPATPANPAWYHTTGLTQGPNILNGDACNYTGVTSNNCYVFTDRGTYQYLRSTNQAQNLQILTRTNDKAGARGGLEALVNSFHAYGVNPDAFSDPTVRAGINTTAARNFLNWITSVPAQNAIGAYLASDQAGAPFLPDAAPNITTGGFVPAADKTMTVKGTVANVLPGAPALNGVTVNLRFKPSASGFPETTVATATTGSKGNFSLTYKVKANGTYRVTTPAISKIENPDLDPVFGDLLAPGATPYSSVINVASTVSITALGGAKGFITGTATITPADQLKAGSLVLYASQGTDPLTARPNPVTVPVGATKVPFKYTLPAGAWNVAVHFVNDDVNTESISKTRTVTVR